MSQTWTPRPYMEEAIEFAVTRPGSGLMLDPGLGKTSITLAVISLLRKVGEIRKTLVIAPLRVCKAVWIQEGMKWANFNHLRIVNLHPLKTHERANALRADNHVYLINPESMEVVLPLLGKDFDLLVVDESTKFKDTQTKRFKALRKVIFDFKRRIILTGTPVPNGLQDLVGQMFIVDYGESLGKFISHFRLEFMHKDYTGFNWLINPGAEEHIYKRVSNKLMRLNAVDHLDMPELINNFIMVDMPKGLRGQYNELEKHFITQMESTTFVVFNASAVGIKLRQMANGFIYDSSGNATPLHNEKLDALEELVEEMQGRPLFVAYEFIEDAKMIMARFPQAIDLGKAKNVEKTVDDFNDGLIPLMIAHPASVGHGLNLQKACSTVCWYGITWNLELYQQFIARVWRQGQPAPRVIVHHLVCKDTKDEDVMQALGTKDVTQQKFNEAIKKERE
jgi:SNF2 family DNA or RNA helicase